MRIYEKGFKEEATKLANEIGAAQAAKDLDIPVDTLYGWVSKSREYREVAFVGSGNKRQTPATAEMAKLMKEIRELKRANEILKSALGFFAERQKK